MEKERKDGRGGRREGAGRPRKRHPRNTMLTFRVSARTAERIRMLRELTKDDTYTFVEMLDAWVEELAEDYGVE